MLQRSVVFLLACAVAVSGDSSRPNEYMDNLLKSILPNEARFSNVDPATLPPFTTRNNDSFLFTTVNIKLKYSNGVMTGLLKGERAGDCSPLRRDLRNRNTTMSCILIFKDIKIQYSGSIKYGKIPSKSINAYATMTPTYVQIDITASNDKAPYLKSVLFTQIGDLNTRFTGLGSLLNDDLKEFAENGFVANVRNQFFNIFNSNWFPSMKRAVSRVHLPSS